MNYEKSYSNAAVILTCLMDAKISLIGVHNPAIEHSDYGALKFEVYFADYNCIFLIRSLKPDPIKLHISLIEDVAKTVIRRCYNDDCRLFIATFHDPIYRIAKGWVSEIERILETEMVESLMRDLVRLRIQVLYESSPQIMTEELAVSTIRELQAKQVIES